jgi:5-methyltetrahydropteroyltriglutamate--homocysteine methyltransferase
VATTPYRADQVGSLLRPKEVLEAHAAHAEGRLTLEQLREIEDRAIVSALDMQRQAGVQVFTDGEYRRAAWMSDFADAVDGYVPGTPPVSLQWRGLTGEVRAPSSSMLTAARFSGARVLIGEKLRQRRRLTAHESGFLKAHAPGPCKITFPAASYVVSRAYRPEVTGKAYSSRAAVLADVAAILRAEIQALVDEGIEYVQIDNPHYPDYIDASRHEQWRALGLDPDQTLAEDIEADNACLQGIDRSRVTIGMHLCRGNGSGSTWHTAGGYDRIAEQVFGGIDVDRWLLEYDSDRAGGFEPLRHVPPGKVVVLGLVTTKQGELEAADDLLRRLVDAARYVAPEYLALSPQCGFASVADGNLLSWDDQRRKLELVAETARRAWG